MIKCNLSPSVAVVAIYTGGFRVVFIIQGRLMDVLMAIDTFSTNLPEAPFVILFMTGETGSCQVSSGQLKMAVIMPFYGKTGSFKSQD